jgi:uncharacterized protein (TIGR02145 family)
VVTVVSRPVTGITLSGNAHTFVGSYTMLTAIIIPFNATNRNVTWASSNTAAATVDADGRVTGVGTGTTIILATTECGARTASRTVMVSELCTSDAGVVINGVTWATRNVDMPGTFAEYPESAGMFYQWSRNVGWSNTNPLVNSNGSRAWSNTNPTGNTWETANDPCPTGWRVPTQAELTNLRNQPYIWTRRNGVNGSIFGTAPNQIFLPAAGRRTSATSGTLISVGASGSYWSSTSPTFPRAWTLGFSHNGSAASGLSNRADGFSIRCVAE